MVELIAIGDALPPAAALLAKGPTPLSTMTWLLNMLPRRRQLVTASGLSERLPIMRRMAAPANPWACGTATVNPLPQQCKVSRFSDDIYLTAIISRAPFFTGHSPLPDRAHGFNIFALANQNA